MSVIELGYESEQETSDSDKSEDNNAGELPGDQDAEEVPGDHLVPLDPSGPVT